jgi:hypothetical protein
MTQSGHCSTVKIRRLPVIKKSKRMIGERRSVGERVGFRNQLMNNQGSGVRDIPIPDYPLLIPKD